MLKISSHPIDVTDFQFKLHCRLKVFQNEDAAIFNKPCSIVSAASRFGLIFVGSSTPSFQVIQIQSIEKYTVKDGDITDYPRRNISIPSIPRHMSVNCDSTKLAVVIEKNNCATALIYDVPSFLKQNVQLLHEIRLSTDPNVKVHETCWNPSIPTIYSVCKEDGSLGLYDIKDSGIEVNSLPIDAGATCMCWSPKGKQIAVGSKNGVITQYKPDLKAAKIIKGPPLEGNQYAIALQWISNYQFIAIYHRSGEDSQSSLIVIDAPKTGDPVYTNYDDICYSNGNVRPPQFYTILQPHWNILMVASSNSIDVGVMAGEKEEWIQWIMGDAARAELPLSASKKDTLPVGLAFDTGSTHPMPWGESELPPTPYLLVLSHCGVLCCFNVVYLKEGAPSICQPPDQLPDKSGLSQFTKGGAISTSTPAAIPPKAEIKLPEASVQPAQQVILNIPSSKPLASTAAPTSMFMGQPTLTKPVSMAYGPFGFAGNVQTSSSFGMKTQSPMVTTQSQPITSIGSLFGSVAPNQNIFGMKPTTSVATTVQQLTASGTTPFSFATAMAKDQTKSAPATSVPFVGQTVPSNVHVTSSSSTIVQHHVQSPVPSSISVQQPTVANISLQPPTTVAASVTPQAQQLSISAIAKAEAISNAQKEALLDQKIREDCINLETDLKILLHKAKSLNITLGTDVELTEMVQSTNFLQEFVDEITETTTGQAAEVHTLKQGLIQAWAWYEDARSRFSIFKDPTLMAILRAQPLDPASERQLADIEHLLYYLDSQLSQANGTLDEQWNNFQDSCKKTMRLKMPTMEAIYQSMVCQNATLQKQMYILKDIQNRLKNIKRYQPSLSLLVPVENTDCLEDELKKLQLDTIDLVEVQYERVLERQKKLTKKKEDKLKELLQSHEVSHVSIVKPQFNNTSMEISTLLGAPLSPIGANKKLPKKLDFIQSTPKPKPIETKQNVIGMALDSKPLSDFTPLSLMNKNQAAPVLPTKPTYSSGPITQPFKTAQSAPPLPSTTSAAFAIKLANSSASVVTNAPATASNNLIKLSSNIPSSTNTNFGTPATVKPGTLPFASAFAPTTQSTLTFGSIKPPNLLGSAVSVAPITSQQPTSIVSAPSNLFGSLNKPTALVTSAPTVSSSTLGNILGTKSQSSFGMLENKNLSSGLTITPTVTSSDKPASSTFQFAVPSFQKSSTTTIKPAVTSAATTNTFTFSLDLSKTAASTPVTENNMSPSGFTVPQGLTIKPVAVITQEVSSTSDVTVSSSSPITITPTSAAVPSKSSIFGKPIVQGSFFGATTINVATPSSQSTIFGTGKPILATAAAAIDQTGGSTSQGSAIIKGSLFGTPAVGGGTSIFGATVASSEFAAVSTNAESTSSTVDSQTSRVATTATSKPSIFSGSNIGSPSLPSSSQQSTGSTVTVASASLTNSASTIFRAGNNLLVTPTSTTAKATTTTISSIFGTPLTVPSGTTTSTPTFGVTTTTSSTFGTTTAAPGFGAIASNASIFGGTSIFGVPTTTTAAIGTVATTTSAFEEAPTTIASIFGTATTASSAFGTITTTASGFGTATTVTSSFGSTPITTASTFGPPTTAAPPFGSVTTAASPFGAVATTASPFGMATTTTASPFGFTTTTAAPAFGSSQPFNVTTTTSSIFGSSAVSSSFGTATTTTNSGFGSGTGIFGTPSTQTGFGTTAQSGVFNTTTTSSGSLFGQPSNFGSKSIFGAPAASSAPSAFGNTPTSASPFAATTSTGFGATTDASTFSFAAAAQNVTAFGGSSSGGTFGFGSLSTGTPTTTSGGGFGNTNFGQAQNPFGRTGSSGQEQASFSGSLFGSATPKTANTSIFGSPTTSSTTSLFGSSNTASSPFGSKPGFGSSTFGSSTGSFGQQSTFGQNNTFGSSSFGSSQQSGPFSGGTQNVVQAGFGGAFSGPSTGFGAAPVFGSTPGGFGSPPTFGGAPTFGSTSSFGSPGKVFGAGNTGESFVSAPQQQNSTFASLANQNTLGFGSLAQQSPSAPASTPFSGGSSFSTWR